MPKYPIVSFFRTQNEITNGDNAKSVDWEIKVLQTFLTCVPAPMGRFDLALPILLEFAAYINHKYIKFIA